MNYTKGEMQNYGLDGMPHYIKDRFNGNAQLRVSMDDAVLQMYFLT